MDNKNKLKIESEVLKKLLNHLQNRTDVQNIDLMNLANFCRNCISKWYVAESEKNGEHISYDDARSLVYGMPYEEYKKKYQKEATKEQLEKFNEKRKEK